MTLATDALRHVLIGGKVCYIPCFPSLKRGIILVYKGFFPPQVIHKPKVLSMLKKNCFSAHVTIWNSLFYCRIEGKRVWQFCNFPKLTIQQSCPLHAASGQICRVCRVWTFLSISLFPFFTHILPSLFMLYNQEDNRYCLFIRYIF